MTSRCRTGSGDWRSVSRMTSCGRSKKPYRKLISCGRAMCLALARLQLAFRMINNDSVARRSVAGFAVQLGTEPITSPIAPSRRACSNAAFCRRSSSHNSGQSINADAASVHADTLKRSPYSYEAVTSRGRAQSTSEGTPDRRARMYRLAGPGCSCSRVGR